MSEMEMVYGRLEEFTGVVKTFEDTDEYQDWEESQGGTILSFNGLAYKFTPEPCNLNEYGGSLVVGPSQTPKILVYFYNGGCSLREAIEKSLEYLNHE